RRVAFADAVYRQRAFQAIGPAAQRARPSRAALRPVRHEVVSHRPLVARGGPLPEELARGSLFDIHLSYVYLVCARRRRERKHGHGDDDRNHARDAAAHGSLSRVDTSYVTLYFLASARTTAVRCSAAFASIQSCSTTPRSASNSAGFDAEIALTRMARQPSRVRSACQMFGGASASVLANSGP